MYFRNNGIRDFIALPPGGVFLLPPPALCITPDRVTIKIAFTIENWMWDALDMWDAYELYRMGLAQDVTDEEAEAFIDALVESAVKIEVE